MWGTSNSVRFHDVLPCQVKSAWCHGIEYIGREGAKAAWSRAAQLETLEAPPVPVPVTERNGSDEQKVKLQCRTGEGWLMARGRRGCSCNYSLQRHWRSPDSAEDATPKRCSVTFKGDTINATFRSQVSTTDPHPSLAELFSLFPLIFLCVKFFELS